MKSFFILLFLVLLVSSCKPTKTADVVKKEVMPQPVRVSSSEADAAEPAIAISPDGNVYVAWVDHHVGGKGDVMVAQFDSNGQLQNTPVRVNPQQGTATAWRGDPPVITVAPDQSVFVSWTAKVESAEGHATNLYVSTSRDRGRTFTEPVKVNDDQKPAVHGMHSLTVGTDGRIYVAWLDERNVSAKPAMDMKMKRSTGGSHMESNREVFIASSVDGARTFSTNKRVATNVCPCCKTSIATGPDGRVYLSWRQVLPGDFRHIAVASSLDHGETFSQPKIVSDDQWMIAGCPVSGPSIGVSSDGSLQVLWYSAGKNGETGLYSSRSNDGGNSFDARTLVAKGEIHGTPVLLKDKKAIWESSGGKIVGDTLQSKATFAVADGELPAAVELDGKLVTAYIAKGEQYQAVYVSWVMR
jgi:hypothetical protein